MKLAVNESPQSGYSPDYDAYGYGAYSTGAHQTVGLAFADPGSDPLFGAAPDATGSYAYVPQTAQYTQDQAQGYGYSYGQDAAYEPVPAYDQAAAAPQHHGHQQHTATYAAYDASGDDTGTYGTGAYDTTGSYETSGYAAGYDPYAGAAAAPMTTGTYYDTGTYDTTVWQGGGGYGEYQVPAQPQGNGYESVPQQHAAPQQDWDSGAYPAYGYGYGYGYDASGDTGVYEQVPPYETYEAPQSPHGPVAPAAPETPATPAAPETAEPEPLAEELAASAEDDEPPARHDYASDGFPGGPGGDEEPAARSRRRKPHKRSALLTVAVPSVAVMGVAAVGAAAVAGVGAAQGSSTTQADGQGEATNAPTTQFDRQLAGVSRDADDFATRASRTQERIDLKDRQVAAKAAKAAAAARKEALRPKFLLPVKERGLSAYFGQAGVNWMALHTGIDFPVQTGTPVMSVTDGTVRTQWNSSYGNMAIVTAPDGTETWYCHLSSTKIRTGSVKAGEVIAYSGNTGNTTGPHLHFEVRPGGGAPIDPLPWLLAHGLDPR